MLEQHQRVELTKNGRTLFVHIVIIMMRVRVWIA